MVESPSQRYRKADKGILWKTWGVNVLPSFKSLEGRFAIVAHRGASAYKPENTVRAVRRALEMGADAVEVDVRLSADGYPVVIHDETVDRTTNGSGRVDELTLSALRQLDAGLGEKIPLLGEVLEEVKGRAVLFVELKLPEVADKAVAEVVERDMLDDVLFISFFPEALIRVRELVPSSHIGLIYFKPPGGILEAKRLRADAVLPKYNMATEKAVKFAKRLKLYVVAWTVDDPSLALRLKQRGVDAVATNAPDKLMHLRSNP